MKPSIPEQIVKLLDPDFGSATSLSSADEEFITAAETQPDHEAEAVKPVFKNKIVFQGNCGFAMGGQFAYVLNTDKFNAYRVTVKNAYRCGIDYGELYTTVDVSAGGKISLSCTDSGYIPVTYYTYTVEGEQINNFTNDEYAGSQVSEISMQLPVSSNELSEIKADDGWAKDWLPELTKVYLSLYIGWSPPGDKDAAKFLSITVNGTEVSLSGASSTITGLIVPLGQYEQSVAYLIAWKCKAGHVGYGMKTVVGYFKNNDLNTRKILVTKNNVSTYDEWDDAGTVNL
ncbi:hypothetical protein ACFQ3S_09505 [Mucilaginibacter terrae]|uniref:hypothetical protein n=1 Tax=Mucilaginibacter terrae TaxID=1955052 RepID=UPI0036410F44